MGGAKVPALKGAAGWAEPGAMAARFCTRLCSLVAAVLLCTVPASGQIYRWVGSDGTTHFTDRPEEVPAQYRDQLENVEGELDREKRFTLLEGLASDAAPSSDGAEAAAVPVHLEPTGPDLAELQRMLEGEGLDLGATLGAFGVGMLLVALLGFASSLLFIAAIGSLFLKGACRMAGEPSPGFVKAMGIVAAQMVAATAFGLLAALVVGLQSSPGVGASGAQLGASFLIQAAILRGLHADTFGKALVVTLLAAVMTVAFAVGAFFLVMCAGGLAAAAA
jgi:hypothetical protein